MERFASPKGCTMTYHNFYLLKGSALWCAVPYVSVTDGQALLLVGVICFLAALLFARIES